MPSSKRPPDRWSSIAVCSATRAGWFTGGVMFLMPVPMWMRSVCPAMKPRNDSFADRCEYSSRKWCSVAQVYLKPARSAALVHVDLVHQPLVLGVDGVGFLHACGAGTAS